MDGKAMNDWRLDERGHLDDVAVSEPKMFRMERMSDNLIWGAIEHQDGSRTTFHVCTKRAQIAWTHEHEGTLVKS